MVSYNVYVPKLKDGMSPHEIDREKELCDRRYNELRDEMEFVDNKGYPTEAALKKAWNAVDKKMDKQIENIRKCLQFKKKQEGIKQTTLPTTSTRQPTTKPTQTKSGSKKELLEYIERDLKSSGNSMVLTKVKFTNADYTFVTREVFIKIPEMTWKLKERGNKWHKLNVMSLQTLQHVRRQTSNKNFSLSWAKGKSRKV